MDNKKEPPSLEFRSRFLILQNVIGVLLSVPVLVTGIYLRRPDNKDCATFMENPVIAIGGLLLVVSLWGLIAALIQRLKWQVPLAGLHLLIMFCLVILLFCFAIFSLEITNNGLAHNVQAYGQTYKEYRLYEYPKWMRHRVQNPDYWSKVKLCLQRSSKTICGSGVLPAFASNQSYTQISSLTPVQRGCCLAPSACNITYLGVSSQREPATRGSTINSTKTTSYQDTNHEEECKTTINATIIRITSNTTIIITTQNTNHENISETIHAYTHDCKHWSNVPSQLCYDCDTCRAGIIQASMDHWKNAGILYVVLVMTMVVTYAFFACYAFKEPRYSNF